MEVEEPAGNDQRGIGDADNAAVVDGGGDVGHHKGIRAEIPEQQGVCGIRRRPDIEAAADHEIGRRRVSTNQDRLGVLVRNVGAAGGNIRRLARGPVSGHFPEADAVVGIGPNGRRFCVGH